MSPENRLLRVDAGDKITGKALYTEDLSLPQMLCAVILRSPLPHAAIVGIDTARALRLAGPKASVTAGDTPRVKFWSPKSTFLHITFL